MVQGTEEERGIRLVSRNNGTASIGAGTVVGTNETSHRAEGNTVPAGAPHTQKQMSDQRQRQLSHVLYWRFFVNLALMLMDAAMFLIASATVLNLRHENHPFYTPRFGFTFDTTVYLIVATCFWIWSLHQVGVYHRHIMGDGYQLNLLLIKGMAVCWIIQCAFHFFFKFELTLTSLCLMVASGWALTVVERMISRAFLTRSRKKGEYAYGTVIVGSPQGIGRMLRLLAQRQQLNYRPVAVCPIRFNPETGLVDSDLNAEELRREINENWGSSLPVLQYSDNNLAEQFLDINAQTVMVTDVLRRYSDNYNTFSVRMESLDLEIAMIASAADTSNHEIQIRSIQGTTIITQRLPQYSVMARFCKRLFDIIVSAIAIVVASPIMFVTAILIKADDGGPVFYKQQRIGLRGKPFCIHKFRSMRVNADKYLAEVAAANGQELGMRVKIKKDPRITKIGHFIRKTSIDELPQFFDSFIGTMSVVGPRPQRQFEVDEYNQVFATRLLVKPGITGPWQVSGRNDLSDEESEALDVAYVQNWSVMGDLIYILRTVGTVLHPNGAY